MRGGFLNAACGGTLSRSAATYAPEHWLHCRPELLFGAVIGSATGTSTL